MLVADLSSSFCSIQCAFVYRSFVGFCILDAGGYRCQIELVLEPDSSMRPSQAKKVQKSQWKYGYLKKFVAIVSGGEKRYFFEPRWRTWVCIIFSCYSGRVWQNERLMTCPPSSVLSALWASRYWKSGRPLRVRYYKTFGGLWGRKD